MRNIILIMSCVLCLVSFWLTVNAQTSSCPNGFRCGSTLVDPRDGNSYPTVQIGTQCWMAKNLQATKFQNGDAIPNDSGNWGNLNSTNVFTPAYCFYNNNNSNPPFGPYGAYYNWYAVTDIRGLCPRGWYVPTSNEFAILGTFTGANSTGYKLASTLWTKYSGTDAYGFNALPAGNYLSGTFNDNGNTISSATAEWWTYYTADYSCEEGLNLSGWPSYLHLDIQGERYGFGWSVRCVRGIN